jgi:hypothetical protein
MSSWDHDSDPERWYHSSKQAWRHTEEWPSWSEARLDTEAHVTYLEKQVADLRTNVTQLTTRLEKVEVCSLNHEALIALLSERGSQRQDLQFVVEARRRGILPDERRHGILPVAVHDAPRRQGNLPVDPWQGAAARRHGILPGGVHVAACPQICSTLHSRHKASVISPTVLESMSDPQYSWMSSVDSKGLGRILDPMYEALNRRGAAWRFRREGKKIYTAQLACAHCCTMFQLVAEYSAGTFSVETEENLAKFLLVEHTPEMQLRPEEWSH